MADLTERLALTQGTNRVIDDPANPSGIGAVLDFAKDAIAGYSSIKQDLAAKKARTAAAEEKATESRIAFDVTGVPAAARNDVMASQQAVIQQDQARVQSTQTTNEATAGDFAHRQDVFAETDVGPDMEADVIVTARKAGNTVTAVRQGRMPEISMQSAVNARFRALREKYPEHTEYLVDMFKKAGIDPILFTEIKDAVDEHAFERKQQHDLADAKVKRRETAITAAREILGPDALTLTDDELEIHGLSAMKQSHDLQVLSAQAEIQSKQASLSKDAATLDQTQLDEQIFANINNSIYNQAGPVIKTVVGLVDSLGKNPNDTEALQRWQANGVRIHQMIPQIAENALQQAIAHGYKGDPDKFKSRIMSIYGPLTDAFTGDHSVVKANVDTLTGITTSFKINSAQALPIMMSLQAAGMKPAEMPAVVRAVETNPALQKSLQAEVNGYLTDWGKDRASTHVLNMIKLFRGEATLARMDPAQARASIGTLTTMTDTLAKNYVRGLDVDGMKVVHGFGEIVLAATALTPSSGATPTIVATRGFADEGSRQALIKTLSDKNVAGEDRVMALATVQASRAGSAHLLNNIMLSSSRVNEASPYFKMVWDKEDGKYKIDRSAHRAAMANANFDLGDTEMGRIGVRPGLGRLRSLQNMQPPEALTNLIKAANMNLDNAIELGKYDPSTPKATDKQLRNWYGRNVPIPGEGTPAKPINSGKEIDKQLDALDAMTTQTFANAIQGVEMPGGARSQRGVKGQQVSVPPVAEIATKYASNGNYQAVVSTARELGIPADIATRLGYVEGRFNDNMTPNGAGAMGPIQVVPRYHNPLAQQLFGKNVPELTPAQIVKVGLTFLKNEYNKYGNWNDALSAYHSGGPLSKRGNSNDGNLHTRDYVELIGG